MKIFFIENAKGSVSEIFFLENNCTVEKKNSTISTKKFVGTSNPIKRTFSNSDKSH